VLDWLHLLGDRGLLRKRGGTWALTGEPPPLDANELAHERLQALGAHARRIFEAACIGGDAIDSAAIAALVPDAPQSAYQRVVNSRLLRAVGGKRWSVASDRYLAAALGEPSVSLPLMHQRFAALLVERARTAGEQPDASHVAEHLTRAGDGLKAMPIWRRAAEQALTRRAPRDALAAFKGWADALALMPGGDGKNPEVVRARLDALSRAAGNALTGDDAVLARTLVDDGLALARTAKLITAELQLMVARVLRSEARRARSAEALQQSEKLARGTPIHALCWFELGEVKEAEGDAQGAISAYNNALAMGETAAELARWYGEIDFRAAIEVRLAGLARAMDPPSAKKLYASALNRLRTVNAPFQEARVLGLLGELSFDRGEYPEAIRALEESAAAAARSGDLLFQARQLVALSRALARAEQNEMAWKRAEAGRRLAMSVGWVEGRRDAEQVLAHLKAKQGKA
jgi:tetratricopeptide (TPR) repeat protein